jgi:hypothetical protein
MSGVCHVLQLCYCDVWCVSCATVVLLYARIEGQSYLLNITVFLAHFSENRFNLARNMIIKLFK